MGQRALFDAKQFLAVDPNPCVQLFGKDPEGRKCKRCENLRRFSQGKAWYKCLLRRSATDPTRLGGPSTDHRVNWNACAKIVERNETDE